MNSLQKLCDEADRLVRTGELEPALNILDQLRRTYPEEPQTWTTCAHFNSSRGNYKAAVADMSKAIQISKDEPAFYFTRGRYFFKAGEFTAAVEDFTVTIDLSAKLQSEYYLSSALFFRADAYVRLGRYREAKFNCERVPIGFKIWTDQLRSRQDIMDECSQAGL